MKLPEISTYSNTQEIGRNKETFQTSSSSSDIECLWQWLAVVAVVVVAVVGRGGRGRVGWKQQKEEDRGGRG